MESGFDVCYGQGEVGRLGSSGEDQKVGSIGRVWTGGGEVTIVCLCRSSWWEEGFEAVGRLPVEDVSEGVELFQLDKRSRMISVLSCLVLLGVEAIYEGGSLRSCSVDKRGSVGRLGLGN